MKLSPWMKHCRRDFESTLTKSRRAGVCSHKTSNKIDFKKFRVRWGMTRCSSAPTTVPVTCSSGLESHFLRQTDSSFSAIQLRSDRAMEAARSDTENISVPLQADHVFQMQTLRHFGNELHMRNLNKLRAVAYWYPSIF